MFKFLLGDFNVCKLKCYQLIVLDIQLFEEEIVLFFDDELCGKIVVFQECLVNVGSLVNQWLIFDEILFEVFVVICEVGKWVLGMCYFDVQLIGGMVLYEGQIVEMKIGEGKIFVVIFLSYFNVFIGCGVYVVMVNDYLVCCDVEWMGQVYCFFGLFVGLIQQDMCFEECWCNYNCDIIYVINLELGFDYLCDNMVVDILEVVQWEFQYCVIDEVDLILIDEVCMFLIIFGQVE